MIQVLLWDAQLTIKFIRVITKIFDGGCLVVLANLVILGFFILRLDTELLVEVSSLLLKLSRLEVFSWLEPVKPGFVVFLMFMILLVLMAAVNRTFFHRHV